MIIYAKGKKSTGRRGDAMIVIGRVALYAMSRDLRNGSSQDKSGRSSPCLGGRVKDAGDSGNSSYRGMQGSSFLWSAPGKPSSAGNRSRYLLICDSFRPLLAEKMGPEPQPRYARYRW